MGNPGGWGPPRGDKEVARVSGQGTWFLVVAVLKPERSDTIEIVPG
jgi:hypothetical protein